MEGTLLHVLAVYELASYSKPAIVFSFLQCPTMLDKQANLEIDYYHISVTSGTHVLVEEQVAKDVNKCVQSLTLPLSLTKDGPPYTIMVSAQNAIGTSNGNPLVVAGTCIHLMYTFNVYSLCLIERT